MLALRSYRDHTARTMRLIPVVWYPAVKVEDNERQGAVDHGTYEIRVQGQMGGRWAQWFDDMTIHVNEEAANGPMTVLTGPVADQAALLGLLQKLYTLGLPLLSVQRKEASEEDAGQT